MSLAIRIYVGLQFFKAGLVKIGDWSATLSLFRDEYHVPVLQPEQISLLARSDGDTSATLESGTVSGDPSVSPVFLSSSARLYIVCQVLARMRISS